MKKWADNELKEDGSESNCVARITNKKLYGVTAKAAKAVKATKAAKATEGRKAT